MNGVGYRVCVSMMHRNTHEIISSRQRADKTWFEKGVCIHRHGPLFFTPHPRSLAAANHRIQATGCFSIPPSPPVQKSHYLMGATAIIDPPHPCLLPPGPRVPLPRKGQEKVRIHVTLVFTRTNKSLSSGQTLGGSTVVRVMLKKLPLCIYGNDEESGEVFFSAPGKRGHTCEDPRSPAPFSRRLKLRTVVSIAPEGPMEDEAMFCREHAAQLVPIRAELYREEAVTVSSQQVAQVR